ncbi:MAG TPA: ATP-binding protein [Drouetiella sp.]
MTASDQINILLVDDRPENLLVLKATLGSLGCNLVEAQSGKEALKYLLEKEFAVILLDVMMPEMDGFEVARIVREREKSKHTPIIFVTAMFLDDQDAFRGYSVGAVDYIMKPFAPEILRSKVTVFVDLFRKTEEIKRQSEHIRAMEQREYAARLQATEERLQQEAERERNEARAMRSVLEHAPAGFARLDKNHRVIETNKMFLEQFKVKDEVKNQSIFEALPGLPAAVRDAIEKNGAYLVHDLQVYEGTAGETNRYCDLAVWPTQNDERFTGTILVCTDVTERVLLDLQRKDFVATLAHDLQTPVIASDRALSLLLGKIDGNVSPDLISFVGMLKKNNENLLHMIESLLDIYHYEEGAKALYCDEVDLKLLAATCIDELSALSDEQGVTLKSDFADELHQVFADRTAIRRVITNLLDNSLKFTPKGGSVTARARNEGDKVIFEVTDTGIGIKPEDKGHLFERYWHGTGHKSYKGSSGLGLYLCRQIVESHSGQIECDTSVDKMTTFRFTLPIKREESEQPKESQLIKQSAH